MIELANAPHPKPVPSTTSPLLEGQRAASADREMAVVPTRPAAQVQAKPVTSFGRRS